MRIVLVEDDWLQEESIRKAIGDAFPEVVVESFETELEFRTNLDRLTADPPALVIFDVMIRWTDPGPDVDDSILDFEPQHAGLRCRKLLLERAPQIPTLFYSILEPEDVGEKATGEVCFIRKRDSFETLLRKVEKKLTITRRASS